jgi:hypothetical protein
MQKLPYVLLFVVLSLVVLNIATLRQLDRLERRIAALEPKPPAATVAKPAPAPPPAPAPAPTP